MKDGGAAFPNQWYDNDSTGAQVVRESFPGMSLRDWFAGQALQGFCASEQNGTWIGDATARDAYSYADAMLTERDKEE